MQEIFISFALIFLGALAYLAGGIVPAMALSEIKFTKEIIRTINDVLIAITVFVLIYFNAGYLLASFLSIVLLLLLFTEGLQEKYFMFLPLLLAASIVMMDLSSIILCMIVLFFRGMIDYDKSMFKHKKTTSWKDIYVNNILYLISVTIIVMFIFGIVY